MNRIPHISEEEKCSSLNKLTKAYEKWIYGEYPTGEFLTIDGLRIIVSHLPQLRPPVNHVVAIVKSYDKTTVVLSALAEIGEFHTIVDAKFLCVFSDDVEVAINTALNNSRPDCTTQSQSEVA